MDWRPTRSCMAMASRTAWSSSARPAPERTQGVGGELALEELRPRLAQLGRANQAADMVGAERRLLAWLGHASLPLRGAHDRRFAARPSGPRIRRLGVVGSGPALRRDGERIFLAGDALDRNLVDRDEID